jgi:hypothetical protein
VATSCGNKAPHRRAWLHSAGDGRTGEEVTEKTCSDNPASPRPPGRALGRRSYASRGCPHALSRGAAWGKDGSRLHNIWE